MSTIPQQMLVLAQQVEDVRVLLEQAGIRENRQLLAGILGTLTKIINKLNEIDADVDESEITLAAILVTEQQILATLTPNQAVGVTAVVTLP